MLESKPHNIVFLEDLAELPSHAELDQEISNRAANESIHYGKLADKEQQAAYIPPKETDPDLF
jgi:hypothetical protein